MAYCSEWNSRRNLKASIFYAWRNCHCQHNAAVDPGPWTLDPQQFDFFENRYGRLPQKSVDENHGKQKRYPVSHFSVHDFENFPIFGDLRRIMFDIVILKKSFLQVVVITNDRSHTVRWCLYSHKSCKVSMCKKYFKF